MPGQPMRMRHLDAAQHQFAVRHQHMHVIARANPRDQPGDHNPLQAHQILRVGQLDIVVMPGNQRHGMAGGFQDRGIVGRAFRRLPVQIQQ